MTRNSPTNCGKCGLCLNVCPVYNQIKEEQTSPRAKMQLIKANKDQTVSSSPYLKDIISRCLMCGACTANCPSGIDHYTAFMEMREKMVKDHGDPITVRSLIYLLAKEYRLKFGTGIARTGQKLLPGQIARSFKIGSIPLSQMPKLNKIPFRNACEKTIMPDGPAKGTVAYFTGCATNYLFDDTGFAAVGILKEMGYRILIPEKQQCCAVPLLFHGAARQATQNIKANINQLKNLEVDAILVDCSTCGEALTHIYPDLFENHTGLGPDTRKIAKKTMDIMSFIYQHFHTLSLTPSIPEETVATYHAPCHSRNRLGIHLTAEKLIQALPSVTYRKTPDMEDCCGGGGTFFSEYPEITKKIMDKKIKNAKAVGATQWLTDCPVCRMNISGNLDHRDNIAVTHPLTMIYSALEQS